MSAKFCSQCNCGSEEEKGVEQVQNGWQELVEGHSFSEADQDGVEQSEHREDGHKHSVIDDRWISAEGSSNDVTSDGHDDQSEEELQLISIKLCLICANSLPERLGGRAESCWPFL